MEHFSYEPIDLNSNTIRLVQLLKDDETGIKCQLIHAPFDKRDKVVPYEALSYTWGDEELGDSIMVNGKEFSVRRNLYRALQDLQSSDRDRILWINAICIDQENPEERGHQVRRMDQIYHQADEVVFWLGEATYETNCLVGSLRRLQDESIKHAQKYWRLGDAHWANLWFRVQSRYPKDHTVTLRKGLRLLLERPWFKRVWILQEVANAKAAVVCCGTRSVSARIFALAPQLLGEKPSSLRQSILDIMPGWSREGSWWSRRRDLYTILRKFEESEASDPRDKIYALLSLSSDAYDNNLLRADYTKSDREVIQDTILTLFGINASKDMCGEVFHNIRGFIHRLPVVDTILVENLIKIPDEISIKRLVRCGGVKITRQMVRAAAGNIRYSSGDSKWQRMWKKRAAGAHNVENDLRDVAPQDAVAAERIIIFMLEQGAGQVEITEGAVEELARSFSIKFFKLLLVQRRKQAEISQRIVIAAAGNERNGRDIIALLLVQRREKVKITEKLTIRAIENERNGKYILEILLGELKEGAAITLGIIRAAARRKSCKREVMAILLQHAMYSNWAFNELVGLSPIGTLLWSLLQRRGASFVCEKEKLRYYMWTYRIDWLFAIFLIFGLHSLGGIYWISGIRFVLSFSVIMTVCLAIHRFAELIAYNDHRD